MKISKYVFLFIITVGLAVALIFLPEASEILYGVAILLFGVLTLERGVNKLAGSFLRKFLKRTTSTINRSIWFGIISTSLLQSSALVSLVSISFLSAGLITLISGIGIIFGANIGTTTGAWLISYLGLKVNISSFALPMVVFGVLFLLQSGNYLKGIGGFVAGVGFLFLGIHFMKLGFDTYTSTINLAQYAMPGFWGAIVYVGFGILITILMQSSHGSLAIILTALSFNQITYQNALALAIGANIGTTFTAFLGAISSNVEGKRLAVAHLVFNLFTGIIAIVFINQFQIAVNFLSSKIGIGEEDYVLKLSMFHTLFNLLGVLIMIPFIKNLGAQLTKRIKDRTKIDISEPKYLNESVLKYPESAVAALLLETRHLFNNAFEIIAHGLNLHRTEIFSDKKLKQIIANSNRVMMVNIDDIYFRKVKSIYNKIIEFATISQSGIMEERYVNKIHEIKVASRYIVEIVKHIKTVQPNFAKYIVSENEYIKIEYNILRQKVAKAMREIYRSYYAEDIEQQSDKLTKLKRNARLHDVLLSGGLDKLIREKLILTEMATSLMNDSGLIKRIIEKLIEVAELLYFDKDTVLLTENLNDSGQSDEKYFDN